MVSGKMSGEGAASVIPTGALTGSEVIPSIRILDVPVSMINMPKAVSTIVGWAQRRQAHYVCIRDVHGIMQAQVDPELLAIHYKAGLVTPDGMPLVWIGQMRVGNSVGRVCGADLFDELCAASVQTGLRHYFYGGKEGVPEDLAAALRARYPGLQIVGMMSPPFGALTPEQDAAILDEINATDPHILSGLVSARPSRNSGCVITSDVFPARL